MQPAPLISSCEGMRHFLLAQVHGSILLDEIGLSVIALVTLVGIGLRLYVPRHRIETEERIKNNKMTEEQARRQIKFYEGCASWITLIAVVLLLVVLIDLLT